MTSQDALDWAEESGLEHGTSCAPFSPPLTPSIFPEEAEAYSISYFYALAYVAPWPGGTAR